MINNLSDIELCEARESSPRTLTPSKLLPLADSLMVVQVCHRRCHHHSRDKSCR